MKIVFTVIINEFTLLDEFFIWLLNEIVETMNDRRLIDDFIKALLYDL